MLHVLALLYEKMKKQNVLGSRNNYFIESSSYDAS